VLAPTPLRGAGEARAVVCGGELVERDLEKLLKDGIHAAVFKVGADVCLALRRAIVFG